MRKLLSILSLLLATLSLQAQTSLTVKVKEGTDISVAISNIDSVVFTDEHPTQMTIINTIKTDTIFVHDTATVHDTIIVHDLTIVRDTIVVHDTITIQKLLVNVMIMSDYDSLDALVKGPWNYNSSIPEGSVIEDQCWQNTQAVSYALSNKDAYLSARTAAQTVLSNYLKGQMVSKTAFESAYNNLLSRTQSLIPCE